MSDRTLCMMCHIFVPFQITDRELRKYIFVCLPASVIAGIVVQLKTPGAHLEHRLLQHELEKVPEELLMKVPTRYTAEVLFLGPAFRIVVDRRSSKERGREVLRSSGHL